MASRKPLLGTGTGGIPVYCTAHMGQQRQDLPAAARTDPSIREQVFTSRQRVGRAGEQPVKVYSDGYNSLHDPHVTRLYENNPNLRRHLIKAGLLSHDLRVIGNPRDLRQGAKAFRLEMEKKRKVKEAQAKQQRRLERMTQSAADSSKLPPLLSWSQQRQQERELRNQAVLAKKLEKQEQADRDALERRARARQRRQELAREEELMRLQESRLKKRERKLRSELTKYRGYANGEVQPLEPLLHEQDPGVLLDDDTDIEQWRRESDAIDKKLATLRQTTWKDEIETKQQQDGAARRAQEREAAKARRQKRKEDEARRLQELKELQAEKQAKLAAERRKEREAKAEAERLAKEKRANFASAASNRKQRNADKAAAQEQQELEAQEQQRQKALLLKAKKRQRALWEEDRPRAMAAFGRLEMHDGWLEEAIRFHLRRADTPRTGRLPVDAFYAVLSSQAVDLALDEDSLSQLKTRLEPLVPVTDGTLQYRSAVPLLRTELEAIYAQNGTHSVEMCWSRVYCPRNGLRPWYNKATGRVQLQDPTTEPGPPPARQGPNAANVAEGAAWRCMEHAFRVFDGDKTGSLDEEHMFLALQSTMAGLTLSHDDIADLQYEIPPAPNGVVNYSELSEELPQTLSEVCTARDPSQEAPAWCYMYTPNDGNFFFNKKTGEACRELPEAAFPSLADQAVEDTVVGLGAPLEHADGMVEETEFWDAMEAPGSGLDLSQATTFAMMQAYDRVQGDSVMYQELASVARPLMERAHASEPYSEQWRELTTPDGVRYWYQKHTNRVRLVDPNRPARFGPEDYPSPPADAVCIEHEEPPPSPPPPAAEPVAARPAPPRKRAPKAARPAAKAKPTRKQPQESRPRSLLLEQIEREKEEQQEKETPPSAEGGEGKGGLGVPREAEEEAAAAVKIQSTYRGHRVRRASKEKAAVAANEEEEAATKIQSVYRGHRVRRASKETPAAASEEEAAATKIQSVYRGHRVRRASKETPAAASEEEEAAAVKIQSVYRGHRVRRASKEVPTASQAEEAAATKIQSMYRGHRVRRASKETPAAASEEEEAAATKIQSMYRGHRVRRASKEVPTASQEEEAAATKIQSMYRGHRVRRASKETPAAASEEEEAAATKIQSMYRGHRVRRASKEAPTASQEEEAAATKIQSMYRGHRVRRASKEAPTASQEEEAAATKIQSMYRGHRVRRASKEEEETQPAPAVSPRPPSSAPPPHRRPRPYSQIIEVTDTEDSDSDEE